MHRFFSIFALFALATAMNAQRALYLPADSVLLMKIAVEETAYDSLKYETAFNRTVKYLTGMPYVANTLEKTPERLIINLHELDCMTFLENTVAISLLLQQQALTWNNYLQQIQNMRYRNGIIDGYGSRRHYTSEWLSANEKYGIRNITKQLGGQLYNKKINFISQNRSKYPSITDQKTFDAIRQAEDKLNAETHYYIPKTEVAEIEKMLKQGDLIGFTTSTEGLDISHVGFAVEKDGRIYLLHASLTAKKVTISKEPLTEYIAKRSSNTGIIVGRIIR